MAGGGLKVAAEYMKGIFKIEQMISKVNSRTIVEGDFILPDSKLGFAKILDVKASVNFNSKEVVQDKVMLEGIVRYNILYVAEKSDKHAAFAEFDTGFTHYVDTPGTKPKMQMSLSHQIEHTDFEILSNRSISIKTVLNVDVCVTNQVQADIIKDLHGVSDLQLLKETVSLSGKTAQSSSRVIFREDLELSEDLSAMPEILRKEATIAISEKKVQDNKVVFSGIIRFQIVYSGEEHNYPIKFIEKDCQFNQTVEVPGAFQGMECELEAAVQEVLIEPREDIRGILRIMGVEAVIALDVHLFELNEEELITDAYCPSAKLEIKSKKVKFQNTVGFNRTLISLRELLESMGGGLRPSSILYTHLKPILADCKVSEGKVMVDGFLLANLMYLSDDSDPIIYNSKHEVPFKDSIDIPGAKEGMDCKLNLDIKQYKSSLISRDRIELRADISVDAKVIKQTEKDVLYDVTVIEGSKSQMPGLFIYFVRKGDTLWSVAKKYDVKVDEILQFNELEDQTRLIQGEKLIIYKKLDESLVSKAK
jgi:LysM repeat protein